MVFKAIQAALAASFVAVAAGAAAQQAPLPYGAPISLDNAKRLAAGAAAEARKNNWGMAIAITDPNGSLVYFEKLDGTQNGSVNIAIGKARSAALFKRPTKVFQDLIAKGPDFTYLLGLEGAVVVQGGIPIVVNGQIVGAAGASGGTGAQDVQVIEAGLATMK